MNKKVEKFIFSSVHALKKASPTILSVTASIGVVVTAALTAKATPKAMRLIDDAASRKDTDEEFGRIDAIKACWKCYIPAASFGMITVLCIAGSSILNQKKQASLVGAYTMLQHSFDEYRQKIIEMKGEELDKEVRHAVAESKKNIVAVNDANISSVGDEIMFFDELSERYLERTMEQVRYAEYHLNRMLQSKGFVSLNEFYRLLEIEEIESGDVVGWNYECLMYNFDLAWIDFEHEPMTIDDGPNGEFECYYIHVYQPPDVNYYGWDRPFT